MSEYGEQEDDDDGSIWGSVIEVGESSNDIRQFLRTFLDETKLTASSLTRSEWRYSEAQFRKRFEQDPITKQYQVAAEPLYHFINEVVRDVVGNIMMEMVNSGEMEMLWGGDNFIFRKIKPSDDEHQSPK